MEKKKIYYLCLGFTKQQYNIVKQSEIMKRKPMGAGIYNAKRGYIVPTKKYINRFVLSCLEDELMVIIKPYDKNKLVKEAVESMEKILMCSPNKREIIRAQQKDKYN